MSAPKESYRDRLTYYMMSIDAELIVVLLLATDMASEQSVWLRVVSPELLEGQGGVFLAMTRIKQAQQA